MRRIARRLWRAKLALGAVLVLLAIFTAAMCANLIAPYDPAEGNVTDRLLPPGRHPDATHWRRIGTDQVGRGVLSRLIQGARASLLVGLAWRRLSRLVLSALGLVPGLWGGPI